MDWGALILLLGLVYAAVRVLWPRREDEGARAPADEARGGAPVGPGARHRVAELCLALTGDPRRDRPLQNRILALGPGVVPLVLEAHAELFRDAEGLRPGVVAVFEETLADFGLACVPVVCGALLRLGPTAPPALSLVRVLERLGEPAAAPVLRHALGYPQLAPLRARLRLAGATQNPAGVHTLVLRDRTARTRADDLDALAGNIAAHPRVQAELWRRFSGDPGGRLCLLEFQRAWLPLAEPSIVAAGLLDADADVRLSAARLAGLLAHGELTAAVAGLATSDPDEEVRAAAVRALAGEASAVAHEALLAALGDEEPEVAAAAVLALRRCGLPPVEVPAAAGLFAPLLVAHGAGDVDVLLAGLDAASPDWNNGGPGSAPVGARCLAAELLSEHVERDPRAKERLFRAAEGRDDALSAAALLALARAGEPQCAELLARQVRESAGPPDVHRLQEAARVLGPAAAVPLARRLRADTAGRCDALLTVLRTVPYSGAVAPLLRALEATHGTRAAGQIAATLAIGGSEVRAALEQALEQPGRGLLTPALAWLAAYGTPADLPALLDLQDRHPALRGILLGLVEAQGEPARAALRARIAEGGDDAVLLALEQRLAILDACLGGREAGRAPADPPSTPNPPTPDVSV